MIFLDELASTMANPDITNSPIFSGLESMIFALIGFVVFLFLGLYIYTSFAYMSIAKKNKQTSPGLAWIPVVGPALVAFHGARGQWWPWLLLLGYIIPWIGVIFTFAFSIIFIIWRWKLLETIKKPGWWSILMIIPGVGFIMLGIAAWSKN